MDLRPGFMTLTLGVATLATPAVAIVAERTAEVDIVRREDGERAETELAALGFAPLSGATAQRVDHATGVRVLAARTQFELDLDHGPIHGHPVLEEQAAEALEIIDIELRKYSPDCLRRAGLRRILLCRELGEGWMTIPSLPNFRQSLLLDIEASPAYLRRVLHHEVFHFIDFAGDGDVQHDSHWQSLNEPGFLYVGSGRDVREGSVAWFDDGRRGFVSHYARSALEEDKAEVFSMWMTRPDVLDGLAREDGRIAAKRGALGAQLAASCPCLARHLLHPSP